MKSRWCTYTILCGPLCVFGFHSLARHNATPIQTHHIRHNKGNRQVRNKGGHNNRQPSTQGTSGESTPFRRLLHRAWLCRLDRGDDLVHYDRVGFGVSTSLIMWMRPLPAEMSPH